MSMIQHLATLSLAATLASSASQHRVDFKATSPDGVQRIDQLWFVTYVDQGGREIVAQAKLASGEYAPLIAAWKASWKPLA